MSSSNNAYKINESTVEEEGGLQFTTEDPLEIKQLDDAIIALSYVITSLEERNVESITTILKDVTHIHFEAQTIASRGDLIDKDEYNGVIYSYFAMKYFEKIKLDKYKQNVMEKLDLFKNK